MGSEWHLLFFLLLTIWSKGAVITAVVFNDLPRTVEVNENVAAGVVASFTVNCTTPSSSGPSVTLQNISPTTMFFNSPNALGNGTFQVTLRPGATLNAREVNQYTFTFQAECPGETISTSQLYIQVKEVYELLCDNSFLDTAAKPLVVPEDIAPEAVIYTVTLKRQGRGSLTFGFENVLVPFTINTEGQVRVPATGFTREQAGKLFQTNIVVKDADGRNCSSFLEVQVQPVYHNTVNFTESSIAVSVYENNGPLQIITQVHAHGGGHVRYQIRSPTVYFTISSDLGVIKNTYNLDLDHNPGLHNTLLVVEAYDILHPTDRATIIVNITVQRRNQQGPMCHPAIYVAEIPETSRIGTSLATLTCVDKDNNNRTLQYHMENNQTPPYSFHMEHNVLQVNTTLDYDSAAMISRGFLYQATILVTDNGNPQQTRDLYVLGPLDYEKQKSYRLILTLKDLDNDVNPTKQFTTPCNITINVLNVNDNAPVCTPDFETRTICSTRATDTSIVTLQCRDEDEENGRLIYTIVGGNTNGRFRMIDNSLFHNTFSFNRDGIFDPRNYELLVQVMDSHTPHLSTTATIIVHVIPWTTTVPTTSTTTTTMAPKKPIILHRTEEYWAPDPWFVVVLTVTGILLLSALGLLFWHFCCRKAQTEASQPLLQNRGQRMERNYIVTEESSNDKGNVSAEVLSLHHHFDGRAQDPVTGQHYLYDSSSGARRWV
ncbi:cadherin-related family member 4 isoform X2 [Sphaerodactylus townsendi]|uniref:cadherin-related family member 4 isoform X2 n=1 Tax=Sphaerodactylus townsendi TaxID=933632 RepID=UPI0020271CFC|nr:cadherin-related family member 4 isoform X2 [Sphaerodactylus townsendi]